MAYWLRRGPASASLPAASVLRRVGIAEDAQAHALPDVAQELDAAGLGLLPARAGHEVVDGVVEERVLVTDDLLEGRRVGQLAGRALGLAPGDVVEVVVLERPVQVIGVAEAVLRIGVQHVVPVAVAAGVARDVVIDVGRAALPGLDAAEVVHVDQSVSTALLWWMRMRAKGRSVAAPLGLAPCTSIPWAQIRSKMFPATSAVCGVLDLQRRALAEEVGAEADVVELVPHHADIVEAAHRRGHVAIGRAVREFHAPGVRVGEHVVLHHHLVDGVLAAHGLEADALVDVLEGAVGHLDVRAAAQQAHAAGLHVDALMGDPVRRGRQVPVNVGEAEGEPADVHVAHARAVDHVDALGHLDAGGVRVLVAGQAEVEPAAVCPSCRTRTRRGCPGTAACLPGSTGSRG